MAVVGSIIRSSFSKIIRNMSGDGNPAKCKVAVVTGGSVGIGYAFAKTLMARGAKAVILGDIREADGQKAASELNKQYGDGKEKCFFVKTDVTKKEDLENLFECTYSKYKGMDIIINNAGLLQDKNWELEINVNVTGLVRGTFLGFQYMGKHNNGRGGIIVNVASILGLQEFHGCPVYDGTKHFIIGFTKSMGHRYYYKLSGVKVFAICPGVTDTNMIDESEKYGLEGFGSVGKILSKGLAALPSQPADACGECLLSMMCDGENGGIWVIENSECYKVRIPDRHSIRDCN